MTTEHREWTRLLDWEGGLNARELGGYATEDGRRTRWGAVVRSAALGTLTEAGRAALADYGVRAIVDLRLPDELDREPNPFAESGDHGIAYTNVSFIDPAAAPPEELITLVEDYLRMLDRYRSAVADVMAVVAGAPAGGVLIHCAAGKDRTGLISALLLGLVGVPDATIADDYALTAELLPDGVAMPARFAPTADVMLAVLRDLTERHGGVESYLLEAGVSRGDLDRLRDRLLAPAGG